MMESKWKNLLAKYQELEQKTMTEQKRLECKDDWFSFYVGRKITYWMTIPLLHTNITPNQITFLSIIALVIGFIINCFANTTWLMLLSWFFYFLWSLLDGVDGNLARYKKQFAKYGDIYDTMGGYAAYSLFFLGMGIGAWLNPGAITRIIREYCIVIGAISSISSIFPRLIYQKIRATFHDDSSADNIRWKRSSIRIVERNISSISGGVMVFSLSAIILGMLDVFTLFYAALNILKMIVSLHSLFNGREREV